METSKYLSTSLTDFLKFTQEKAEPLTGFEPISN